MKGILSILFLFPLMSTAFSQTNTDTAYEYVLTRKIAGKEFHFNRTKNGDRDSLVLVYLGEIKTKNNGVLKIVTARWYWGRTPRATSRIILFNFSNQTLGNYLLTMTGDIPKKIEGSSIVFINGKGSDCKPGLMTRVDFVNGIPKTFFLRCKGDLGDLYTFMPAL